MQERCLWQFFSRTWDRKENIEGIFAAATDMFHNKPAEAAHADGHSCSMPTPRSWSTDFKRALPLDRRAGADQDHRVDDGLKDELVDHTITKSLNHELNHSLY